MGWSVTRDLGIRLPIGDALALVYRCARDPLSMISLDLETKRAERSEAEEKARQALTAKSLHPMFAKYFT